VVDFGDLKALIFECRNGEKKCKSRVSVSPDQGHIPANCPSCGVEWVKYPLSELKVNGTSFSVITEMIAKVREKQSEPWPKFRILLEFDEPELAGHGLLRSPD
jgi:hypothetical protein